MVAAIGAIAGVVGAGATLFGGSKAAKSAERATEQQVQAQQDALRFQQEQLALNRSNIDASTAAALGQLNVPFGGGFEGAAGGAPPQESPELIQARQTVQALEQQMSEARQGVGGKLGEFLDQMTQQAFQPGAAPASGGLGQLQKARAEVTRLEGLQRQATIGQAAGVPFGDQTSFQRVQQLLEQGPGELTPQQQREFGRGIEALQAGFSRTSGGGVSSRALERAQQFGQDFASRRFDQELRRAGTLLDTEIGRSQFAANLIQRGGLGGAGLAGGAVPGISGTFGNIGQAQGTGTLAQSDIFGRTLNELVSGTTGLQDKITGLFKSPQARFGTLPAPAPSDTRGLPFF